jgi:catechol 2,3-dioxygenase-like lactoylglutathione lyase family enzyme
MTDLRMNLLVLKTHHPGQLKDFYAALGIVFAEERHGVGPTHHAGRVGEVVLELYPLAPDAGPADATTRLGFAVADVDAAVQSLEAVGGTIVSRPRRTEWGSRAVVRDPDGRAVELCQAGGAAG